MNGNCKICEVTPIFSPVGNPCLHAPASGVLQLPLSVKPAKLQREPPASQTAERHVSTEPQDRKPTTCEAPKLTNSVKMLSRKALIGSPAVLSKGLGRVASVQLGQGQQRWKSGPYGYTQAKALVYSKYGEPGDVLT
jgi:hypothetical protein